MELFVGRLPAQAAIVPIAGGGLIPVPGNQDVGILVQGNIVAQSWAGNSPYGIPPGAAAWRSANASREHVDVILLEPGQLAAVIAGNNKLAA